jgi:RNA polymerase sigma-70 factor (ECF subfamily)
MSCTGSSDKNKTGGRHEDVLQDVWLKLFSHCCRYEIKNRRAWLFRVTMNTIADFYRRKRNSVFSDELPEELADTISEPEGEVGVAIEPYIKMLPVEYSLPLRMDSLMGMKQEKIAEKLNLEHGAVRTRLHRARKMLKEKIEACFCVVKDAAGSILASLQEKIA